MYASESTNRIALKKFDFPEPLRPTSRLSAGLYQKRERLVKGERGRERERGTDENGSTRVSSR